MADRLDPKTAASSYIHIHRCLGNLASGNDAEYHRGHEPGGYDVGFAMMCLNEGAPFGTFKEALDFARVFQSQLAMILKYDRGEGTSNCFPHDLESLREVDLFSGRAAYVHAEDYLKSIGGGPYDIIGDLRRCRYGWLVRWDTKAARRRWGGKRGWYAWEGPSQPYDHEHRFLLVLPPKGEVYEIRKNQTLEDTLCEFMREYPEIPDAYEINPDYDLLVNAGVDGWRADCVLAGLASQIEVVWNNNVKHKYLDPRYEAEAQAIVERAATAAGIKLDPV